MIAIFRNGKLRIISNVILKIGLPNPFSNEDIKTDVV